MGVYMTLVWGPGGLSCSRDGLQHFVGWIDGCDRLGYVISCLMELMDVAIVCQGPLAKFQIFHSNTLQWIYEVIPQVLGRPNKLNKHPGVRGHRCPTNNRFRFLIFCQRALTDDDHVHELHEA